LYGYSCGDQPKFRKTTLNSTDIYFDEDEEVDFDTVLNKPLPKIPLDVTFTAHWLAIEGIQPAIPQNPTPSGNKRTGVYLINIKNADPALIVYII
jgi:transcription initiation factor TFIID subunit 6